MSGTEAITSPIVTGAAANVSEGQTGQAASGGSFVQQVKEYAKEFAGKATGKEHEVSTQILPVVLTRHV